MNTKKWLIVLGLTLVHPLLLLLLFPLVGEPGNLVIFVGPLIASWFFSWQIGIAVAFTNSIGTAVIFSTLGGQNADGRPMGIVFFLAISALCFGLASLKQYLDKSKSMAEELENLRQR